MRKSTGRAKPVTPKAGVNIVNKLCSKERKCLFSTSFLVEIKCIICVVLYIMYSSYVKLFYNYKQINTTY